MIIEKKKNEELSQKLNEKQNKFFFLTVILKYFVGNCYCI